MWQRWIRSEIMIVETDNEIVHKEMKYLSSWNYHCKIDLKHLGKLYSARPCFHSHEASSNLTWWTAYWCHYISLTLISSATSTFAPQKKENTHLIYSLFLSQQQHQQHPHDLNQFLASNNRFQCCTIVPTMVCANGLGQSDQSVWCIDK